MMEVGDEAVEVAPPWVTYPGIAPWEFFWREAGEPWLTLVWEPFYKKLNEADQAAYLERWAVPQDWQNSYFNKAEQDFWDHVDDPD